MLGEAVCSAPLCRLARPGLQLRQACSPALCALCAPLLPCWAFLLSPQTLLLGKPPLALALSRRLSCGAPQRSLLDAACLHSEGCRRSQSPPLTPLLAEASGQPWARWALGSPGAGLTVPPECSHPHPRPGKKELPAGWLAAVLARSAVRTGCYTWRVRGLLPCHCSLAQPWMCPVAGSGHPRTCSHCRSLWHAAC